MAEVLQLDPTFILDLEHRPKFQTTVANQIPLIDLSGLNVSDQSELESLVNEIRNACKDWGFFQLINHGVPFQKRKRVERAVKKFFAQPVEEKRKYSRNEKRALGYYDTESTKNVRDWKEVFDFACKTPSYVPSSYVPDEMEKDFMYWQNDWPQYPLELREVCEDYGKEMEKLAYKLTELIAMSLGLPANRFDKLFEEQNSWIRFNHYPPCPFPELSLGVGRHKDTCAVTIIAEDDVGGFQFKRRGTGEWVSVKPIPNAFIIGVSEIFQVWSNDIYESMEHQATLNPEKDRFTTAYFFYPAYYTTLEPIEELVNEENPVKYEPYSWGKAFVNVKFSKDKKRDDNGHAN